MKADTEAILQTENLTKVFRQRGAGTFARRSYLKAVDRVSFEVREGEMMGLLGESGCGKSTLARLLIHLIKPTEGKIILDGKEIQTMSEAAFRPMRQLIQMVFQNPFDCLDPARSIESLLTEPLTIWHPDMPAGEKKAKLVSMLKACGLPENSLSRRPKEFSGGQLQRISIARALLAEPKILLADEIISALDVPIQNQILTLLLQIKEEYRLSVLFITHDLSVARAVSDRVMVMREGRIRGIGSPEEVFSDTADPYIKELASSVFTFRGVG